MMRGMRTRLSAPAYLDRLGLNQQRLMMGGMDPEERREVDRDWFVVDDKGRMRDQDAPARRRPNLLGVLAGLLVLGVGAIAVVNRMGATDPPRPSPTVSASSSRLLKPTQEPTVTVGTALAEPKITTLGHPLLGVSGSWNLFGLGSDASIRIEPAKGRIETTPVPSMGSGGPVSFIAGVDRVLIRPIDAVAGYVVPDGAGAQPAKGALAKGGFVFRGPDPAHVWAQTGTDAKPVMSLVAFDGSSAGKPSIPIPADMSPFGAQSDGSGSLIFQGTSGAYAVRADGLHRITTGQVVAAWSDGWLVSECDDRHRCSTAAVDKDTGTRRDLGADLGPNTGDSAASPDGRFAAVPLEVADGSILLVIDLRSGARRQVPVTLTSSGGSALAWSPDGRWLLAVASDHTIRAVDPTTWRVTSLGVALPPVDQLTVRP